MSKITWLGYVACMTETCAQICGRNPRRQGPLRYR